MIKKLKSYLQNEQIFVTMLIILVAAGSFILGQLSVTTTEPVTKVDKAVSLSLENFATTTKNEVKTVNESPVSVVTESQLPYVASKSGTKYHHLTCPGAKQIKASNKIFFATVAEAEAAGYSKAQNCDQQ